jgi:predicted small metal-binding protein
MAKETIGGTQTGGSEKRYKLDCRDAGQGCSLSMTGTYEEVFDEAVEHGKRKHGMSGDKVGDEVKSFIKEDVPEGGGRFTGESKGRYPDLPA